MSEYNHKSVNFNRFSEYVKTKLWVHKKTEEFYKQRIFRKLKLNAYFHMKRSEQWMLERFRQIFGDPNDVIIKGPGLWNHNRRNIENGR